MYWDHLRIADDEIYLNEDRYNNPKENHVRILNIIKTFQGNNNLTILDCGCATGELTYYLSNNLKNSDFSGFDISEKMIKKAQGKMPSIEFFVQDIAINYDNWTLKPKKDVVILSGVINAFDNYEDIIKNLIFCCNQKGKIIITLPYNKDPVDVIMRYRRFNSKEWECGWNVTSKESIEKYLKGKKEVKDFLWEDISPPNNVPKRINDPMRKWTTNINGVNTTVVGSGQIINMAILIINLY